MLKNRFLGKTGIEVSELGLGSWPFSNLVYGSIADKTIHECLEMYFDAGGNFIDTARRYGESEVIIGRYIKDHNLRDKISISTKTQAGNRIESVKNIRSDLEDSLKELQTDRIDLYYLHLPPEQDDVISRVLDELDTLKMEGKIRATGASIKGSVVDDNTVRLCEKYVDSKRIDAIMVIYNILRQKNSQIFDRALAKGVGIIARSVLESGFLTGLYDPESTFSDANRKRWPADSLRDLLTSVTQMRKWAVQSPYRSLSQVAIRFALEAKAVTSVVFGAMSSNEVAENLDIAELPPLQSSIIERLRDEYGPLNDTFNPKAEEGLTKF